ncbi:LamG-like jellyroll fold domain-containing protein [Roseibacillus ishigakijimensis]|uniref:LamG-like jellyroll fold domain-containing protein n=1 Tax=Roseibacillus ishigakijimensis TaxID=454146 RepID=A0A934RTV3_9BACT|nr:LamG-like jellyroll fold domain-containing protein [Roseibacillus ishigakijimensis]MBK1834939.1 hypothetical protein [Roseibacillus ishigakijimensis]
MNCPSLTGAALCCVALSSSSLALTLENESQTHASLSNETITLSGKSYLHLTGSGDPLANCTIHLNSEDSWVFLHDVRPSTANAYLSRFQVNGEAAVNGSNLRLVQYANGSVFIPHSPSYQPMEIFTGQRMTGQRRLLSQYAGYNASSLGSFNDGIRSFTLKRGYMATIAAHSDGTGASANFVAQDADLEVSFMPGGLDRSVSFIRVFPWRWATKKGSCDVSAESMNATWFYNWSISTNSTQNWEYVAIKQQPNWPSLNQNWQSRGITHVSGFNEPDNPVEDAYQNLTPQGSASNAASRWPELLGTGLRVGAPAVTDGGLGWLNTFMSSASSAGHRVDYVPVHYYRSSPGNNPQTAANAMYNFLASVHNATGLPVWVTEFNNGANWTDNNHDPNTGQNRDVIEAMINMMDSTPWIERYAIYSDVEWFRRTHYEDGSLTPMGSMYRNHKAPMAHRQVVPNTAPGGDAFYPFEDNLRDQRNGNNPLAYGTPHLSEGKYGNGLSFDGQHDFLRLPGRIGDSSDFTFAAWVKWDGGANWQRIFDIGTSTNNFAFLTPSAGDTGQLRFGIRVNGGSQQQLNGPALRVGSWTHVAVTLEGDTGTLYVNGRQSDTQTITHNPSSLGTEVNYLGKSLFSADPLYAGQLDEVLFQSSALSANDVIALMTSEPATLDPGFTLPSSPIDQLATFDLSALVTSTEGPYHFRKVSGAPWLAVAIDGQCHGVPTLDHAGTTDLVIAVESPGGTTVTATLPLEVEAPVQVAHFPFENDWLPAVGRFPVTASGEATFAPGAEGQALAFDGSETYLTLPNGLVASDELTIATWVYWEGSSTWQRIFDFGSGTNQYLFLTPKAGGSELIRFAIKNGGNEEHLEARSVLRTNRWQHLAVTLGPGEGRLYLNGSLAAINTDMTLSPADLSFTQNYLGKSQHPDPLFAGRLDDFQVFHRVLNDDEIDALAETPGPGFAAAEVSFPELAIGESFSATVAVETAEAVSYEKAGGPRWLQVAGNGKLSGTPGPGDSGSNLFRIRAVTAAGRTAEQRVIIPVTPPADLRAHYQFQNAGSDSAGSFTGTLRNGTSTTGLGFFDGSAVFDGSDDDIAVPATIEDGLSDLTIALRYRWHGGGNWQRLLDFGNGTSEYMFLTPHSGNGTLQFGITAASLGATQRLQTPAPPIGEWVHVAVSLTGDTTSLYLNGALVETTTEITLDPADFNPAVNKIGSSQWSNDPAFHGEIDDFRLYDRGLSAAEVAALVLPPAPAVPLDDYQVWATAQGFAEGEENLTADPDGDGLANAFEFLLGHNPLQADLGEILFSGKKEPASELGLPGEDHYLTYQARVRIARSGLNLSAGGSADLSAFDRSQAVFVDRLPDGEFEILRWRYHLPISPDNPKGFLRLEVTGAEAP